jgi:Ion channel
MGEESRASSRALPGTHRHPPRGRDRHRSGHVRDHGRRGPADDGRHSTNFPSLGDGLWWALQTVTTVGYGDHVPTDAAGRIVAALVMLLGLGFITVITASITSAFVEQSRQKQRAGRDSVATAEQLQKTEQRIDARLERIEAALSTRD